MQSVLYIILVSTNKRKYSIVPFPAPSSEDGKSIKPRWADYDGEERSGGQWYTLHAHKMIRLRPTKISHHGTWFKDIEAKNKHRLRKREKISVYLKTSFKSSTTRKKHRLDR